MSHRRCFQFLLSLPGGDETLKRLQSRVQEYRQLLQTPPNFETHTKSVMVALAREAAQVYEGGAGHTGARTNRRIDGVGGAVGRLLIREHDTRVHMGDR